MCELIAEHVQLFEHNFCDLRIAPSHQPLAGCSKRFLEVVRFSEIFLLTMCHVDTSLLVRVLRKASRDIIHEAVRWGVNWGEAADCVCRFYS